MDNPLCDRCRRPAARRRALYGRARGSESAILAGRFGRQCFYDVAAELAQANVQPEHGNARIINLRAAEVTRPAAPMMTGAPAGAVDGGERS